MSRVQAQTIQHPKLILLVTNSPVLYQKMELDHKTCVKFPDILHPIPAVYGVNSRALILDNIPNAIPVGAPPPTECTVDGEGREMLGRIDGEVGKVWYAKTRRKITSI